MPRMLDRRDGSPSRDLGCAWQGQPTWKVVRPGVVDAEPEIFGSRHPGRSFLDAVSPATPLIYPDRDTDRLSLFNLGFRTCQGITSRRPYFNDSSSV